MERSPKRQCIITRQLLPSDYLIKLKPRSFNDRNYLVPPPFRGKGKGKGHDEDRGDSRSFYLKLHQEAITSLSQPGPHLGLLRPHGLEIPTKFDEWVRTYLAQRILDELNSLVSDLRKHTPKVTNILQPVPIPNIEGVVSLLPAGHSRRESDREQLVVQLPGSDTHETSPTTSRADVMEIDLSHFPDHLRPGLYRHFADLFRTERTYTIRNAISRGGSLSTEIDSTLIGKPPSHITADGSGFAGRKVGISYLEDGGERGQLGVGVMIALLRWRLYSGDGWTSS